MKTNNLPLWSEETDHEQAELSNTLVKKNVLNEIKKQHSLTVSRTAGESKGKYLKILTQKESISKFRWSSKLADKVDC